MRLIAGFELPTVGEVHLGGKLRGETPPYHRPVNTVFQSMLFSLIMSVNVFGNVAVGLKMRKVSTSHLYHSLRDFKILYDIT